MKAISADSHVVEMPEVFSGLAEKYGDDAPRVISKEGEGDTILIPNKRDGGVRVANMAMAATRVDRDEPVQRRKGHKPMAGKITDPEIQNYIKNGYSAMHPGLREGARRGECQDMDGVSAEVLYPGYFPMFRSPNLDLLISLQKNYNDWLANECSQSKGRLFGLAALPVQDPVVAVEEFKRALKMGYKGVIIPSNAPENTSYADAIYDPIWALAEESGTPISMHVGCFSYAPPWVMEAVQRDKLALYGNTQSLIQETMVDLMVRGVCKRFPNVKFVLGEFNAGWVAHFLDRLDQAWQRDAGADPSHIPYEDVIMETWRRQFYVTIEDDQPALMTRSIIGEDNLMWGSDFPHTDSTFPCSAAVLDEMFADHGEEARRKITYDNVKKLYGI